MQGSTFYVCAIILALSVIANILLGFFGPFITEADKERIEEFSRKKFSKSDKLKIKLKYRFSGPIYIVVTMFACLAIVVALGVGYISEFVRSPGNINTFGMFLMILSVFLIEGIAVSFSILIEEFVASSIVRYYKDHYGVEITRD